MARTPIRPALVGAMLIIASGARSAPLAELVARPLSPEQATDVRIDGRFDEGAWEGVPVVAEFVQREPKEGAPATYPTEVRVVYDADSILVAVTATDPDPARLVGFRTRRPSKRNAMRRSVRCATGCRKRARTAAC